MRLLLVEDHRAMREMIVAHLQGRGFAIDAVSRGEEAIAAVSAAAYDAVILDLGLPDMDGMDVLRQFRRNGAGNPPALILTARDSLPDRVDGLNAGADDYIHKPFELTELEARLRAVLRRPGQRGAERYRFAGLEFDPTTRQATLNGDDVDLTRREATVLEELVRTAGRIVVKDVLEDRLYGFGDSVTTNALEAAVSRLRRKLATTPPAVRIESVRGVGYRLKAEG